MPGQALPVVGESGRTLEYPAPLLEGTRENMMKGIRAKNDILDTTLDSSRTIVEGKGEGEDHICIKL